VSSATLAAGDLRAVAGRARRRAALGLGGLAAFLLLAVVLSLGLGAFAISPGEILRILLGALSGREGTGGAADLVLLSLRLPRALLGLLVGGGLALCGAVLQGLFRNPLADPGLIGVSAGAAVAAAAMIVLGGPLIAFLPQTLATMAVPFGALLGGLVASLAVYAIAHRRQATDTATLLLAGIGINAVAAAGISFLLFLSSDQQLRDFTFWMLGSLGGANWRSLLPALVFLVPPLVVLPLVARALDALLLGEASAFHLGFRIETVKRLLILLVAVQVGAAVALSGMIGFVGLLVPHLARLAFGPGHRVLLPASAMLGAGLMLLADLLARTLVLPAELPIGVLTSLVGGPVFLLMLMRRSR